MPPRSPHDRVPSLPGDDLDEVDGAAPPVLAVPHRVTGVAVAAEGLNLHDGCEEEATQTEDLMDSSLVSDIWSADSALEDEPDDGGPADTVMGRLTKRMGNLFPHGRRDRGTQTLRDPLTTETEKLAFDIIFYSLGRRPPSSGGAASSASSSCSSSEVTACLRRTVTKMLEKHSLVFNSMVSRLAVDPDSDLHQGFQELSNELFQHSEISWSKIVALFAFGARLAQYCQERGMPVLVFDVASNLSQFAVERLTPFLREHGGWATLCEAFPSDTDYESTIWKSLVFTGLGLTAVATILALQK